MIDQFSKSQFEAALPRHKVTGQSLCQLAFFDSEYVYKMHVGGLVWITTRSSVGASGYARPTGADSIRCWLSTEDTKPLAGKLQKYTTRVPGWADRLKVILHRLFVMGLAIAEPCKCGSQRKIFKCKSGKNQGVLYVKCWSCGSLDTLDNALLKAPKPSPSEPLPAHRLDLQNAVASSLEAPATVPSPRRCSHGCIEDDCDKCWGNKFGACEAEQERAAYEAEMEAEIEFERRRNSILHSSGGLG